MLQLVPTLLLLLLGETQAIPGVRHIVLDWSLLCCTEEHSMEVSCSLACTAVNKEKGEECTCQQQRATDRLDCKCTANMKNCSTEEKFVLPAL